MKIESLYKMLKRNEDGSIVVIIALFMTVLIGLAALVLDMGMAYNTKSNLQKDLDSIALAAVRNLPANDIASAEWNNAKVTAREYAAANGISTLPDSDIIPVYEEGIITGIQIKGESDVQFNFARVFLNQSKTVYCDATAKLMTVSGMADFIPLSIEEDAMERAENDNTYVLKYGAHEDDELVTNGWFGTLGLDGNGSNTFEQSFKYGATTIVNILDFIDVENGVETGASRDGFNFRITGHEGCHLATVDGKEVVVNGSGVICADCPRVVSVPVVQEIDKFVDKLSAELLAVNPLITEADMQAEITRQINILISELAEQGITNIGENNIRNENTGLARVVGLASVFLESIAGNGANSVITAKYLPDNVAAGTIAGVALNDYGIRAAKLVD
ncbi:pilus assembly protein TadG-related protein [Sedimentibacter sp. B4]|uniref:pilus assembly protein TadG-related protein n=1 Tax=Sedimentibacter sp. B4 TaxID=304766 RepID=UPI0002D6E062|nr:Tad domain-containing protein [Sedimentibacter sp. B4]